MGDRDSQSGELDLISDPEEKARVEASNALRQTKVAMQMLPALINAARPNLRPSLFLQLHRVLMQRVSRYPGVFRPGPMSISHSDHKPPPGSELDRQARPILPALKQRHPVLDRTESRPVLYGGVLTLVIAIIGWIFFE